KENRFLQKSDLPAPVPGPPESRCQRVSSPWTFSFSEENRRSENHGFLPDTRRPVSSPGNPGALPPCIDISGQKQASFPQRPADTGTSCRRRSVGHETAPAPAPQTEPLYLPEDSGSDIPVFRSRNGLSSYERWLPVPGRGLPRPSCPRR